MLAFEGLGEAQPFERSKIGQPDPGGDSGGGEQAQYEDGGGVRVQLMGDRGPEDQGDDTDGDPADEAGATLFDTGSFDTGFGRGHLAGAETWPARTSSVVFRTRFRSRRTWD